MAAGFESPQKAYQQSTSAAKTGDVSHREEVSRLEVKNMVLRNNQSAASIPSTSNSAFKKVTAMNIEVHD